MFPPTPPRRAGASLAIVLGAVLIAAPERARADIERWPPPPMTMTGDDCSERLVGSGRTLDLGPGRPYTDAAAVPWLSLRRGDVVNVHYRAEPYRVKIALSARGTRREPVVVNGVTDADCNRPTISGERARIADDAVAAGFFRTEDTERLGTIFLYRKPTDPWGSRPRHVTLRNLVVTGAREGNRYVGQDGVERTYLAGAAGIYAIVVDHLSVENCTITGNGNGVFVNSRDEDEVSSHVILRANALYDNGNPGSWLEHNVYVQARRALYEGNLIGQLVPGAEGSSLKDRSSGTVVRYNRILAAARALDLVEIEGGIRQVLEDPLYDSAWVYGNILVDDLSGERRASVSLVHFGGDNDERYYRRGTLHWYHNTMLTRGDKDEFWYIVSFDTPALGERVLASNNAFVHEGSSERYVVKDVGRVELIGEHYFTEGWRARRSPEADVSVASVIEGANGARVLDRAGHPQRGSALVDAADTGVTRRLIVTDHGASPVHPRVWWVTHEPASPWGLRPRRVRGLAPDLGAFESR